VALMNWIAHRFKRRQSVKVLVVCAANICRSPLAEGILRGKALAYRDQFDFVVESRGVHAGPISQSPDPRVRKLAERHGVNLKGIKSQPLEIRDFCDFDVIFAMDNKNLEALRELCPADSITEIRLFRQNTVVKNVENTEADAGAINEEIPDPYYGNLQGFENVFQLLDASADSILRSLAKSFEGGAQSIEDNG